MLTSYDLDPATCFAALLIGQPTLRTRLLSIQRSLPG